MLFYFYSDVLDLPAHVSSGIHWYLFLSLDPGTCYMDCETDCLANGVSLSFNSKNAIND